MDGFYIFMGLTFRDKNLLQNNDKKQYSKIEKILEKLLTRGFEVSS